MTDGVFVDIKNAGCIKDAIVRFDNLTLLTGTDTNAIFAFVNIMQDLHDKRFGLKRIKALGDNIYITPNKKDNDIHYFDFLINANIMIREQMYNGKANMRRYLKKVTSVKYKEYDTAILYMPEVCLPGYDSTLLTYLAIKYLVRKNVDTIVVTQAPHIMSIVADYADYLFYKYDINCNCCIAENGVIECDSHKEKGDISAMLEKAFKLYNKSFDFINKMEKRAEEAKNKQYSLND